MGKNVTFNGGFAIQEDFSWLTGFTYDNIQYVNPPMKHEWQQRVVRIYDPDYHIIEIGVSMAVIAIRYLSYVYMVEETSKIIQHPFEFVEMCLKKVIK